jgi:hypothetical protein
MSKLATRRAVMAGWLECVFSQDAQTILNRYITNQRAGAAFGAGLYFYGNTNAIAETKPLDKPPWLTGR